MSSRAKRMVQMAQKQFDKDTDNSENDINLSNVSRFDDYFLETDSRTANDVLSPEDVAQIIERAEIIFKDDFAPNDCNKNLVPTNQVHPTFGSVEKYLEPYTKNSVDNVTNVYSFNSTVSEEVELIENRSDSELEKSDTDISEHSEENEDLTEKKRKKEKDKIKEWITKD